MNLSPYPVFSDLAQLLEPLDALNTFFDHAALFLPNHLLHDLLGVLQGGHPLGHAPVQPISLGSSLLFLHYYQNKIFYFSN